MASLVHSQELRTLYETDRVAKFAFNLFLEWRKSTPETTVDFLLEQVQVRFDPAVKRSEIIKLLKQLEHMRCGVFLEGRRQRPSRFVWEVETAELGQLASGRAAASSDNSDEGPARGLILKRSFPLRPGLTVDLFLPENLSRSEARRLAVFIKSLPFGVETKK